MANPNPDNIETVLRGLFVTGRYSDYTITCRGNTFPVHRAILCYQTRFFHVATTGPYAEAVTKVLDLPADDPRTILRLLCYLYTRDYDPLDDIVPLVGVPDKDDDDHEPAEGDDSGCHRIAKETYNHLRVYVSAEKYGIPALMSIAMKRFHDSLEQVGHNLLPGILQEIMTTVPRHGEFKEFLRPVATLLGKNVAKVTEVKGVRDILWEFKELAMGMIYAQAIEIASMRDKIKTMETNRRLLKQRIWDEQTQRSHLACQHHEELTALANRLKQLAKCEGCSIPFNVKVQVRKRGLPWVVCCKMCNTSQWMGD